MEREIGKWNKATGIKRPILGKRKWEELWVGDIINCQVYITDRAGGYLHIHKGEVSWDKDYGQYCVSGEYEFEEEKYSNIFALHKVVRSSVQFVKKVPRVFGHQRDILLHIAKIIREMQLQETDMNIYDDMEFTEKSKQVIADTLIYDALDQLADEISKMGVIPAADFLKAQYET